jgi:hypothetical protein
MRKNLSTTIPERAEIIVQKGINRERLRADGPNKPNKSDKAPVWRGGGYMRKADAVVAPASVFYLLL